MDREFFMNAGIQPPQHLDSTRTMPFIGLNCTSEQSFLEPNSSVDQYAQFESALMTSMVSSSSGISSDAFSFRELIGKLGGAGNFPPQSSSTAAMAANPYDSRHGTPLSSPSQLHLSILDSNLGNSVPLASISSDLGFAERAAKFSCFGNRSFNGRTAPIGLNNGEFRNRSGSPLMGNGKLPRVSSSPILKQAGSPQIEIRANHGILSGPEKKLSKLLGSDANSNEESSVSEQILKTSNEQNPRKRKGVVSRGKPKEDGSNSAKEVRDDEDPNAKRLKATENESVAKTEEEQKEGSVEKPAAEPIKDYIHVRARRGQATDSHSLAERVRREKIGERMKLLQDLVPGCNKVTGKALMLDEIINYVQSLQRQVEFLSMKLATVNPELDFNIDNTLPKDMLLQQKGSVLYPLESSAFYNHNQQSHQNVQQIHTSNFGIQLPSLDAFSASLPEFPSFCEDDLHSIVQMGFAQNTINSPVPYQLSDMKAER